MALLHLWGDVNTITSFGANDHSGYKAMKRVDKKILPCSSYMGSRDRQAQMRRLFWKQLAEIDVMMGFHSVESQAPSPLRRLATTFLTLLQNPLLLSWILVKSTGNSSILAQRGYCLVLFQETDDRNIEARTWYTNFLHLMTRF